MLQHVRVTGMRGASTLWVVSSLRGLMLFFFCSSMKRSGMLKLTTKSATNKTEFEFFRRAARIPAPRAASSVLRTLRGFVSPGKQSLGDV